MTFWIFIAVIVLIALTIISIYNSLVSLRFKVKNAWAQIDVQLKRRFDLIPNLIETCKGYLKHERETLEKVVQARNMGIQATGAQSKAQANNMLTESLKSLFAVVESYPDLKANQNMLSLQAELASTENQISSARAFYNNSVQYYNTKLETFPSNLIAGFFKFNPEEFFSAPTAEERQVPKVNFS